MRVEEKPSAGTGTEVARLARLMKLTSFDIILV
jgi:hypothetical protein